MSAAIVEPLDPALEPVEVFHRLAHLPHVVFFDSAVRGGPTGRYSFVAADPICWWESAGALDEIARLAYRLEREEKCDSGLPPFQGGLAGAFGYELAAAFERLPPPQRDEFQLPPLAVGWYDVVIAFDHAEQAAWLISQGWPETEPIARRARAASRCRFFERRLAEPPRPVALPSSRLPAAELAPQFATQLESLTSNFSSAGYQEAVRRVVDYIYAGDVFQVNLSQRLLYPAGDASVELYSRLRARNPAPMAGFLDGGGWQLASASPERFLRVDHRAVETRPIKGTAPLTREPVVDRASGIALQNSAKNRAENVMIVDLMRNDLTRACQPATVRVAELCELEQYAWVQHLVSVVVGTLRDDTTAFDLLRRAFPGGSVTGAPKIRAMEIIAELEPTARGFYCGALGYLGVGGQMDTSILIRTITAARGWWQMPVGGGIVADSLPHDELAETWHKAAGLVASLRPAGTID